MESPANPGRFSLGNRLLEPTHAACSTDDPIQHRERLGGMLNFYYREAA